MTLAEIIEEGERLPLDNDEEAFNTRGAWFSVYGLRLLAVARAAVERCDAEDRMDTLCRESQGFCQCSGLGIRCDRCNRAESAVEEAEEARLALRAAVRGADEGGNDGKR